MKSAIKVSSFLQLCFDVYDSVIIKQSAAERAAPQQGSEHVNGLNPFMKHFVNYTHHWRHDGNFRWWPCNNALHYVTSHSAVQSVQSHQLKYSVKCLLRKTPGSRLAEQSVTRLLGSNALNICLWKSTRLEVTFLRFFKGCHSAKWERQIYHCYKSGNVFITF